MIGRKAANCHPPASVHIVEKLMEDFKAGRKDHEDFWIDMGEKYILIRYLAVHTERGEYLGVLEVAQNIRPIQAIKGEKRLVSESQKKTDGKAEVYREPVPKEAEDKAGDARDGCPVSVITVE